jgi:muramidase (phage lysozyme)
VVTQPDNNRPRGQGPSNGGLFGGLFGGGGGGGAAGGASGIAGFFQALMQLFTGGGGNGGGGLFGGLFGNLFGNNDPAPNTPEDGANTRATIINQQQADLAAKGLYPSTGSFAQDGKDGAVFQHAQRLDSDPNYAKQYMRQALRDPNLDAMDIMKIQASLNKLGYDVGDVNGRMNNETRTDLDKFLKDNPDIKRAVPTQTAEATAPRGGVMGWIMDKVETVKHARDHVFAPSATPGSVKGLLDIIGKHESNGNYNAYYKHANNNTKDFTNMTVNEVIQWQRGFINSGSPSSAVGKYQIINKTLVGLKDSMNLTGNEKFSPELQDRMAVKLLEGRGLNSFKNGRMSADSFMLGVSKEWASMPKDRSGRGYYDGDGLNKSGTGATPVLAAIDDIRRAPAAEPSAGPTRVAAAAAAPQRAAPAARNDDHDFGRTVAVAAHHGMDAVKGVARTAFAPAAAAISVADYASEAVFGKGNTLSAAAGSVSIGGWKPFG